MLDKKGEKEPDNSTTAGVRKEMEKPRMVRSARIAELNLDTTRIPEQPVISMGRCNTGLESTHRSLKPQSLSRTLVEMQCHLVELGLRMDRQVGSFREVLSQQPICVFVGAALPRALRITQVDLHIGGHRKTFMLGHLQPAIPRQRTPQRCRESTNVPGQRGNDSRRVFAGHFDQRNKTRRTLYQGGDMAVVGAAQ